MNKRIAFVLVCVMGASVLLLGLSYSKDSSDGGEVSLIESTNNNLKVVYSDNYSDIVVNDEVERDLSIVNLSDIDSNYFIYVESTNYDDLYYVLDNGVETKLNKRLIYNGEIKKLGILNDQVSHKIKIINKGLKEVRVNFVVKEDNKLLVDRIINDDNVYIDTENNYRYYGEKVNNYIKYNNQMYQIVGFINNKIKLISVNMERENYNANDDYLSIFDYLRSLNNKDATIENANNYKSWLSNENDLWFLDTDGEDNAYYLSDTNAILLSSKLVDRNIKKVVNLYMDVTLVTGDGSIYNPYEVSYGSK